MPENNDLTVQKPKRKFYVGYSFVMGDEYGTRRIDGNMAMEFEHGAKKDMAMFRGARNLVAQIFELDSPDVVAINFFEELE